MWLKWCVLGLALFGVAANAQEDSGLSALRMVNRVYDECAQRDSMITCLKMKAVTFLDRASRSDKLSFGDLLTLERAAGAAPRAGRALTENDLETMLAGGSEETRDSQLTTLFVDRVARFFNSHTLKVSFPELNSGELQRSVEEGRGKMKKMMSMMMMAGAMKAMMLIPIAIVALFLLAGKAFIISKIALVLALIITLKKLLAQKQEHGHHEHGHGWSSGGGGHGGGWDKRSLGADASIAHNLAYNAYKPASSS
ncbi:uncharacterized protein LOC111053689 [Nilaparvata lugens]|uniref:uncharacterized protein LOC111053689 n=1 Tax=Nilaparvata lugens TaxID=108931 RepID=UPI00193D4BB3|nr:uncharacterized protein LOC111053689 [Nilaparvata lugens]